jgi:hypothetical protein
MHPALLASFLLPVTGTCEVVAGSQGGWTLAQAASGLTTASLLLSANLLDPQVPVVKDVEEEVAYSVSWDPTNAQMPRVDMYIGESVTFEWEDVNLRNRPQYSSPNHHNVYLFAGETQCVCKESRCLMCVWCLLWVGVCTREGVALVRCRVSDLSGTLLPAAFFPPAAPGTRGATSAAPLW